MNSTDFSRPPGPVRQLIASVSGLLGTLIGIGRTRLELLTVELREELQRTAELFAWGAVALLAAGGGLLFAGLAIVFAFWDTHRIAAAVLVTAGYFGLAAVAVLRVRSGLRSRPAFLGATLGELARDQDDLDGRAR